MTGAVDEKLRRKYRILVAPLDWGLGHATRCIPVINELVSNDCEVWVAAEGSQEILLKKEFPSLSFLSLTGYRIRYSKRATWFAFKILLQVPTIIATIRTEHRWLKKMIDSFHFDAIISDNRFGLYDSNIPSVFITHQLNVKTPFGRWSERVLRKWNYKYINRFGECWIPDLPGVVNLAGQLSHPDTLPRIPARYIGILSRFEKNKSTEIKDHLLILLSGPEPQRTIFENKIVNEISHYAGTATIVRGLPLASSIIPSTGMIKFYNHVPAKELNEEMQHAEWVIGRSGYSTVMDIVALQKKSILIPTPGQTEQEYLAKNLLSKKTAFCVDQNEFSLTNAISQAKNFNFQFPDTGNSNQLKSTVKHFLEKLPQS